MASLQNSSSPSPMAANAKNAAISALLAALMLMPIFGWRLVPPKPPEIALKLSYDWHIILIGATIVFFFQLVRPHVMGRMANLGSGRFSLPELTPRHQQLVMVLLLVGALAVMLLGSRADISVGQQAMIYVVLALGLNIIVGFGGLLALGYAGFYAIGAYTYAVLNVQMNQASFGALQFSLSFWQCLPLAVLITAFAGFILGLPVLRLRGDYLAIVTLGFGEIIRIQAINSDFFGGPGGINGIGKPSVFGYEMARRSSEPGVQTFHELMGWRFDTIHMQYYLYMIGIVFAIVAVFIAIRLSRMPLGRALEAMREDEIACRSLGLNPTALKLIAFTLGAAFAGAAGALFAAKQGNISPESFGFLESVLILVAVVVGGMGSLVGVIVGGILIAVLVMMGSGFAEYRMLYFGAILVVMMIWRPQGLLPVGRRHVKVKS